MIIMEKYIEGVGYYSSCIIFFNIIFALKMLTDGVSNIEVKSIYSFLCIDLFTFFICLLLLLVGIIFTILIVKEDDNIVDNNTSGKVIRIIAAKEITADNYFTNFSLLVLTGLSIPSNK